MSNETGDNAPWAPQNGEGSTPPPPPPPPAGGAPQVPPPPPTSGEAPPPPQQPSAGYPTVPVPPAAAPPTQPMAPGQMPGVQYETQFAAAQIGVAPAAPSAFTMVAKNLWTVQGEIWKGQVGAAFQRPKEVVAATGNSFLNWLVPLALNSLLSGLLLISFVGSMQRSVLGFTGMGSGLPSSVYVKLFLVVALVMFASLMLRSLAILAANRASGSAATFNDSAAALGVAQTVWWLPLSIAVVLIFLAPMLGLGLAALAFMGISFMVELATYVGVTRCGPHKRSPLVPYAWFTTVAMLVTAFILYVYVKSEIAAVANSISNSIPTW